MKYGTKGIHYKTSLSNSSLELYHFSK